MFKFNESDLTYLILDCKSADKYLFDPFYCNIITLDEAKNKNINYSEFKSVDIHKLAISYADKFLSNSTSKLISKFPKLDKIEDFYRILHKEAELFNMFQKFLLQDRTLCYEFCKNNDIPINIDTGFIVNFLEEKTSFNNLVMHLTSLSSLFSLNQVEMESDTIYIENIEKILDSLYDKNLYKEFLFFFDLICEEHTMFEDMFQKYLGYARVAKFNLRKDFLINPKKKNNRSYLLYFFGCDKTLLAMILSEFKNNTVNLRFEATDNPYGYAFGITVKPSGSNDIDKFFDFLLKYNDFFKRYRERTDKPTMIKMIVKTEYYPHVDIENFELSLDKIKLLCNLGIDIAIENDLGD